MKTLIVAVAVGFTAFGALAQGYFNFGNRVPGVVDAPITGADGTTKLDGAAWLAQAYVGLTEGSLAPVGSALPFRVGNAAGYITSTPVTTTFAANTSVSVEMRVWEAAKGTSYETAVAAGGVFGKSAALKVTLVEAPNLPPNMVGLTSFSLVPEPSTMALGVLGAAALLLRRRK